MTTTRSGHGPSIATNGGIRSGGGGSPILQACLDFGVSYGFMDLPTRRDESYFLEKSALLGRLCDA